MPASWLLSLSRLQRTFLAIGFLSALQYLTFVDQSGHEKLFLLKALPIFCLAVILLASPWRKTRKGLLVLCGLLASAAGDILLEGQGEGAFVRGLSAFLCAHVFYIVAFCQQPDWRRLSSPLPLLLAVYVLGLLILLWSRLGSFLLPVSIYVSVILVMGLAAVAGRNNSRFIVVGACLFILSDSLIAVNRFLLPLPLAGVFVMLTYYLAQWAIVRGVMDAGEGDASTPS